MFTIQPLNAIYNFLHSGQSSNINARGSYKSQSVKFFVIRKNDKKISYEPGRDRRNTFVDYFLLKNVYIYIYIYMYVFIYVCVCIYVYMCMRPYLRISVEMYK